MHFDDFMVASNCLRRVGSVQNETSFVPFCVKFAGGNKTSFKRNEKMNTYSVHNQIEIVSMVFSLFKL